MSDPLALVLAGHLIGDWIVQTDWQAANKVRPDPATVSRSTLHLRPTDTLVADGVIRDGRLITQEEQRDVAWRLALRRSWWANQQHMLGYHVTLAAALAFGGLTAVRLFVVVAVSWVTHSIIDRRWPVRWLMAHTGSEPFSATTFGVIAVDQALHLSILALLVAW